MKKIPDGLIHPTAEVDPRARIGAGTQIWNDCQIREGVVIGNDCILGKGVYIDKGVVIGNRCKIQNYACLYAGVTLGDDIFIGPCVTFTNDLYPRAFTRDWKIIETTVMDGASIGANCTIICGNTVGRFAMIGAGSVLTKNASPYTLYSGNPAVEMRKIKSRP